MDSGGWTQRRLMATAGAGFVIGLAAMILVRYGGPLVTAVLAGALFLGGRALYPRVRRSLDAEDRRRRELRERAEQQHAWAARGDMRGVYGPAGAELMRAMAPPEPIIPPGEELAVATVAETPAGLAEMLQRKPPCWRYAAFVSVLVQRRDAVRDRLLDARAGFAAASGEAVGTEFEAGLFFTERFSDLSLLLGRIEDFMLSPAFQGVFGDREEHADPEGIVHAAGRVMDYHEQLLALNERCRGVRVPRSCAGLQRDIGALTALPLNGFDDFIATFVDRIAEMADVARYATGDVRLDAVTLAVPDDDIVVARVSQRLRQIARSR